MRSSDSLSHARPQESKAGWCTCIRPSSDLETQQSWRIHVLVTYMTSMAAIALPILFICLQLLQMPCIEGITFSEGCKTKFTVPAIMLTTASMTLAYLPWIALAACLLPAIVILIALRKKLHAYNSGKLALPSWTTDLRDVVLRLAVSSTRLALFVTVAVGAAIAACAGWLIYWLLHR